MATDITTIKDFIEMHDSSLINLGDLSKMDANTAWNAIITIRPDVYRLIQMAFENKMREVEQRLPLLKSKAERLNFVSEKIAPLQKEVDKMNCLSFINLLSIRMDEALLLAPNIYNQCYTVKEELKKVQVGGIFGLKDVSPTEDELQKHEPIIKVLDVFFMYCQIYKLNESGVIDEELKQALYRFCIYHYLQLEYLKSLCTLNSDLEMDNYPKVEKAENEEMPESNGKQGTKDFTTARQVLAIHYLMDQLNVYANTDKTEIAKFIQFITGKETGVGKISDTTIYKKLKSPLGKSDKQMEDDLRYIRTYFEKLGLTSITDKINKEIGSKG